MGVQNNGMLKDANGNFIPQYYDPDSDTFKPLTNTNNVVISASKTTVPVEINGGGIEQLITNSLTVTSARVELKAGSAVLANRKQVMIYPPTAGTVYWGNSAVTKDNGAPFNAGDEPMVFDVKPSSPRLFLVSDGTDRTIRVVEIV